MTLAPAITPDAASASPRPARRLVLRSMLIVMAVIETLDGLAHLPMLFGRRGVIDIYSVFGDELAVLGEGISGFLLGAHVATHPVLALAAFGLAVMGRVRSAIVALGAILVIRFISFVPEIVGHGLAISAPGPILSIVVIGLSPLAAACAISCARDNVRLGLATFLLGIPVLFNLLVIIIMTASGPEGGC